MPLNPSLHFGAQIIAICYLIISRVTETHKNLHVREHTDAKIFSTLPTAERSSWSLLQNKTKQKNLFSMQISWFAVHQHTN